MSKIFKTRYQAEKEKKNNPFCNGSDVIVKVDGGYTIMRADEYRVWRCQK